MSSANLKIISSLKTFLLTVSENQEYKNYFRTTETAFTRRRKLSFEKLALIIVQLCKKTLSVEIDKFFEQINSGSSCSVAAFSMQRKKLNPAFFYAWNMVLWKNFYNEYGSQAKRWRGFRVLGCDGSNITLINKPELQSHFGGQSNQFNSFTVAKTFYCYDVLNKMILFPQIAPYRYGELRMAYDTIEKAPIEQDMLLIFDRNFSNYKMAALLQFKEREIKYVIRVKESLNFAKDFIDSKKRSEVVEIFPSPSSIQGLKECGYIVKADTPIKIRLVRVDLSTGKTEVLMSNLWEDEGYLTFEFKKLYALRWGVESNIDFQKNILQLESLSGLKVITVIQDFYATVFVSNLHALLIKQAQKTIDKTMAGKKHPMQINNNKAFGKIKENMIALFVSEKPDLILKILHDYFIRDPLPIRSGRSYPRVRKNVMSKSKFRTFTNFKPAY
jgi:hypothetical protein